MSENYVSKVIKIAEAEVGYLEKKSNSNLDNKTANAGSGNYTKYAKEIDTKYPNFYNGKKNGFAWCDVFVDWCFIKAFGEAEAKKLLCQPSKSTGAGTKYSKNFYKEKGQYYTKNPKVGDQIFFAKLGGEPYHTGIVYKVDDTYVYTIEGNTSSASGVVENGGAVAKKKYKLNYNYIHGYGRPKYDAEPSVPETTDKFVVGDILDFKGKYHYAGSNSTTGVSVKQSKVRVTNVAANAKHPYHCRAVDNNGKFISGVYGWVDAKDLSKTLKSVTEIAKEVLAGKWGNNPTRKEKLIAAGYDYDAVKKEVNKLV